MPAAAITTCPFCGFSDPVEYIVLLHLEQHHNEGNSPFVADTEEIGSESEENTLMACKPDTYLEYFECPLEGCNEVLPIGDLETHLEVHALEYCEQQPHGSVPVALSESGWAMTEDSEPSGPSGQSSRIPKNRYNPTTSITSPRGPSASQSEMPEGYQVRKVQKLGKKELGQYHDEERMPNWLISLLKRKVKVDQRGVIPVLEKLLQQSDTTSYAYLCHPAARHISKLKREGSFCGYRNIQMLIAYIIDTRSPGCTAFADDVPSIFQIQDLIESAWDQGIHTVGRAELGNIKKTRKYIGTAEAQALLHSLGIKWYMKGISSNREDDANNNSAEIQLYNYVERYFTEAPGVSTQGKVRLTNLPPMYFQHQGHSMTIVGFERNNKGGRNLLVFDPSFSDPSSVIRHIGAGAISFSNPDRVLKLYRRGPKYLSRYRQFEILSLAPRSAGR
ncbi:DUF1671-domain-containing protein [Hypomontagnella monticulosa]|nr:DUF1671-domain-containing protein [Hypomontagnella monticulosa]